MSEKVNEVFRVGHAVHKLLAEARSVERLEASTVVHLGKSMWRMNLDVREHEEVCTRCKCVHLTLRRIRGFSGVSGHPSLSLSASSNISVTYRNTARQKEKKKRWLRWLVDERLALHV